MAKLTNSKRKGGIVKLKVVVEKLQKRLSLGRKSSFVREDVKEGHFGVIAEDGEELKRFMVPLSCLTHPTFLRLLEEAAEEYGFDREGAITIPCRPSELERILAQQWQQAGDSETAGSVTCKPMLQSY